MSDEDKDTQKEKPARERILLAAVNEFAQKGFDGASTSGIARKARVTQPLVHYHFETKENLWKETVDFSFSTVNEALELDDPEMAKLPPREHFEQLLRRFVYFNAKHPEFGRMILMEGSTAGPRLTWMIKDYLQPLHDLLREAIETGQKEGWARTGLAPELATFLLIGASSVPYQMPETAQQLYEIDFTTDEQVQKHADAIVKLFLEGLLGAD